MDIAGPTGIIINRCRTQLNPDFLKATPFRDLQCLDL